MVALRNGAFARARRSGIAFLLLAASFSIPAIPATVVLSGSPSRDAVVGQLYRFRVTASPAGLVRLGAANVPRWATFDPVSGTLQGVPRSSDVGGYAAIRVFGAYDGAFAYLPTFTIQVRNPTTSSYSLQWYPPTQNEDGSALTDLFGYRIYAGPSANELTQLVTLPNAGLTSYVVEPLTSGRHWFAITAVSRAGAESELSDAVSVLIP